MVSAASPSPATVSAKPSTFHHHHMQSLCHSRGPSGYPLRNQMHSVRVRDSFAVCFAAPQSSLRGRLALPSTWPLSRKRMQTPKSHNLQKSSRGKPSQTSHPSQPRYVHTHPPPALCSPFPCDAVRFPRTEPLSLVRSVPSDTPAAPVPCPPFPPTHARTHRATTTSTASTRALGSSLTATAGGAQSQSGLSGQPSRRGLWLQPSLA